MWVDCIKTYFSDFFRLHQEDWHHGDESGSARKGGCKELEIQNEGEGKENNFGFKLLII